MIGLTTGRQTSQRSNSLLKEIAGVIPNAKIIRRGKSSREELAARLHEEGLHQAIVICRWHGGPGRIDFYEVQSSGMLAVPPSVLLKSVKLKREYFDRTKYAASTVTCDAGVSEETRRFIQVFSRVFELPLTGLSTGTQAKASFHVTETPDRMIQLAVTSPPGRREVGPKLLISRLLWGANDDEGS